MDIREQSNEWTSFAEMRRDDGLSVPSTDMVVCPACRGKGTHVNPAIDSHGITSDEMYEMGDDFRDDYLSGRYDVRCEYCGGNNVVEEISDTATDEEKAAWESWQRDAYEYAAEREAERRMGC